MDIKMTVKISENMIKFLQVPLNRQDIESAILKIDSLKFGDSGNFLQSINNQSSPESVWAPLSKDYLDWKKAMLGKEITNEIIPPKTVISTRIWIRTGKALKFASTNGLNGLFKAVKIQWHGLYNIAIPLYQVFVKKIDYIIYANENRPLFDWYENDILKINNIFRETIKKIRRRFSKATKGIYKNVLDVNFTSRV